MAKRLEKEFKCYLENQNKLIEKYNGKFIVIKNCEVIGSYDDILDAVEKTKEDHKMGTFLVQKCEPGDEGYTMTFHSRVAFT